MIFQTRPARSIDNTGRKGPGLFKIAALARTIVLTESGLLNIEESGVDTYKLELFNNFSGKINLVHYITFQNDLILCCQVDEKGSGKSRVSRINLDIKKVIWQTDFGGINLSPSIVQDKFLFGSSLGYVGVIDLAIGDIVWEKRDLWEQYQVNSFNKIGINKDTVIFIGKVFARLDNNRMTTKNIVLKYNKFNGNEF
jgi:hypothetical protein